MSPQRRTALISVGAACLLIAIKLAAGLASGSLGLLAGGGALGDRSRRRAAHVLRGLGRRAAGGHRAPVGTREGRAPRRARRGRLPHPRQRSDRRARGRAPRRRDRDRGGRDLVDLRGDRSRDRDRRVAASVTLRAARRYRSDALLANALHFGSDLAGTLAVLAGLSAAALGFPGGDAVAALFVAVLVISAAVRLLRTQRARAHGSDPGRRGGCGPGLDRRARPAGRAQAAPRA